jgi:hypothetical protein
MIEYRGIKFEGYNKPKKSNKAGKKKMVLAKEGTKVKLIHFGDSKMPSNHSAERRKAFKSRFGKLIAKSDKLTAMWWSNKHLWSKGGVVYRPKGDKKK